MNNIIIIYYIQLIHYVILLFNQSLLKIHNPKDMSKDDCHSVHEILCRQQQQRNRICHHTVYVAIQYMSPFRVCRHTVWEPFAVVGTILNFSRYVDTLKPAPRCKEYFTLDQRIFRVVILIVVSAYDILNAISYLNTISGLKFDFNYYIYKYIVI